MNKEQMSLIITAMAQLGRAVSVLVGVLTGESIDRLAEVASSLNGSADILGYLTEKLQDDVTRSN